MLIGKYEITAAAYFRRGVTNLESFEGDPAILFYVALEFRFCIERSLFEYMVLMKLDAIPNSMEKLYLAKDLRRQILKIEPEFIKKLEFVNLYFSALNIRGKVFIPDLDILAKYYGKLGNYLHLEKRPDQTCENRDWWLSFLELLNEIRDYLRKIFEGSRAYIELNEEGWELFGHFKDESASKEEIIKQIQGANVA